MDNEFGPCHPRHTETLYSKSQQFFRIEKFQFQPDLGIVSDLAWGETYSIDSN